MPEAHDVQRMRDRVEARAEAPFLQLLGVRFVDAGPGYYKLGLSLTEHLLNRNGTLHGGVISTLADAAVGHALWTVTEQAYATVDLHVAYIASPKQKEIFAEGKIISHGRRVIIGEADIIEGDGRLLAKGRATYLVLASSAGSR